MLRSAASLLFGAVLAGTAHAGMEIIAHRGAMMLAPENTLASQRLAYELGAEWVEVDVRLTGDNIPVNLHDHSLERTTNGTGNIASLTLAQARQLDAGIKFGPQFAGERIPTIAENIEVAKQYNRKIMFDIKGQFMAPQLVEVIRQSGISFNQIAFLTWWDDMTSGYTSRLPGVKMLRFPVHPNTSHTLRGEEVTDVHLEYMRQQKVTTLIFAFGYVNKADVERFHDAGFEVSSLFNPASSAYYYQDIGLDSFWTDYTDVTVGNLTRTEQQWNSWAEASGLAPDQKHTWMDPDEDGKNNLAEFAYGTDPLEVDGVPMVTNLTRDNISWTVDLREDWSQFITATVQNRWTGPWRDLPASSLSIVSPTRLAFEAPVGSGRQLFRMKFDLIK